MARRTLRNLDLRIMKRVVFYGATDGIGKISTKRIASDLNISEPTIFIHFKTKRNLLQSAYSSIMKSLREKIEIGLFNKYEGKREQFLKRVDDIWFGVFTDIWKEREKVIYAFRFRHGLKGSADLKEPFALTESFLKFMASVEPQYASRLSSLGATEATALVMGSIEMYAFEVAVGEVKPTRENSIFMGEMILHGILGS